MKITKSQLKQIIKEEINEISQKQSDHEARLSSQMGQRKEADDLQQELSAALDPRYKIYVRRIETFPDYEPRYAVVVSDHEQRLQDARDQLRRATNNPRQLHPAREERLEKLIARLQNRRDDYEERGQQEALDLQDDLDPILSTEFNTFIDLVDDRFAVIVSRAQEEPQ